MFDGFRTAALAAAATTTLLVSSTAFAHVAVSSGPVTAGSNNIITLGVGHGCEGADTVQIEALLPKEITQVRGMPSFMGDPELKKDNTDIVRSLIWKKADARPADDFYYQLSFRASIPNTPFTTLYIEVKQTCRDAEGAETVVDWANIPAAGEDSHGEDAPPPAAPLVILPKRQAGWNKFKPTAAISDLSIFNDAQIVWAGDAAYSSNEATAALIESEDGVEELTAIKANTEIWVKY